MKKKFLLLITLLVSAVSTFADDVFTVTSAGIPKGGKGTIAIGLPSSNTNTYAAFQITLTLPTGLTFESATSGDLLSDAHSVTSSGTATVSLSAAASPTTNFTGTTGTLCVLTVAAEATAEPGDITILSGGNNTLLTYANESNDILSSDETHSITVTDGVVLDENSTVLPASQTGVAFTLNRTIIGGVWNTICLPFELTENLAKAKFGEDVQFCNIEYVETEGNTITVNFAKVNLKAKVKANTPYIIKTSSPYESISFTAADNISISPIANPSTIDSDYKFIGTFCAGTTIPADNIFLGAGDNKFYYSNGSNTIKGFRGYFWLKDFSSSADARQLKLVVDGEETTGIEGLYINGEPAPVEGVYNLKGQRVDTPTQKGVYIKDGKKVVIK